MADNKTVDNGGLTDYPVATDEVSYSGDTADVQLVRPAHVAGAEGARTVEPVTGSTGAATPAAAVAVGGSDGTNLRALKTDAAGELQVDLAQYAPSSGRLPVELDAAALAALETITVAQLTAALPAGTNNIGDVDIASALPAGTNEIGKVQAHGDVAHDGANAGNPLQLGAEAIAHGTNPTAVAAGDRTRLYASRAGVPFVIGGHPNVLTLEASYAAAQTDAAIVTVGSGLKIVVTQLQVLADADLTVTPAFRIGFGAANTPTTTGVVGSHPGLVPGSIYNRGDGSGILGVGADGDDLRITSDAPTGGSLRVLVSYYTIES